MFIDVSKRRRKKHGWLNDKSVSFNSLPEWLRRECTSPLACRNIKKNIPFSSIIQKTQLDSHKLGIKILCVWYACVCMHALSGESKGWVFISVFVQTSPPHLVFLFMVVRRWERYTICLSMKSPVEFLMRGGNILNQGLNCSCVCVCVCVCVCEYVCACVLSKCVSVCCSEMACKL